MSGEVFLSPKGHPVDDEFRQHDGDDDSHRQRTERWIPHGQPQHRGGKANRGGHQNESSHLHIHAGL